MVDRNDIDDAQPALIDRRMAQAFAFARVAVTDPGIMDVFEDGSDLGIKDIAPSPHRPENAFIVAGKTAAGESITIAVVVCDCHATRDLAKGKFWLRAGEQCVCPECQRVYAFDGERTTVTEGADANIG